MKNRIAAALALALLGSAIPAPANINFTLATKHGSPESPDPENRYITDGENHIYLRIPRDWKATSSAERLEFMPPQTGSHVQISQVPGVQALPLDPAGLAALRKDAQARLPEGAKNIHAAGEENDLLPVFGWKSFEVTFEYEFYGQQMRRSMLYVNMIPGRVVQVSVTAVAADFENVHEKLRKLMFGWFEPNRDLPPEQARQYEAGEIRGS